MDKLTSNNNSVKMNFIDKAINFLSPETGTKRIKARAGLQYAENAGYITSGNRSRRSLRGWFTNSNNPDQDTVPKLENSRASSRDLYMNTPLGHASINRSVTNVIGSGLHFQSRLNNDVLKLSKEKKESYERLIEREFRSWMKNKKCDLQKRLNFYEMQNIIFKSVLMNGDAFVLLPVKSDDDLNVPLRLQAIESDYCSNPAHKMNTTKLSGGIEVDDVGAPYKYYFQKKVYNNLELSFSDSDWTSIKAFGLKTGRPNVLHIYKPDRISQRRGMPILAPAFEILKQISRLTESELMASLINSFFTTIIKSKSNEPTSDMYIPDEQIENENNDTDNNSDKLYEMGSGNFLDLDTDEDVTFADPNRPNAEFSPFYKSMVEQLGSVINVPSEQLLLKFNTSYSGARAAIQEAWKFYYQSRTFLTDNFNNPVFKEFLYEANLNNRFKLPGFFDDPVVRDAWCGCSWSGTKQSELDPLKEVKAKILKIQSNLSTYESEYNTENRESWEENIDKLDRERELLKSKNINPNQGFDEPSQKSPEMSDISTNTDDTNEGD